MLNPQQISLARHHAYRLFSQLFLKGLTADLWTYMQQIDSLSAVLPPIFDPDEAAAAHQHLLGFNLFPYASIFLASDGLLGGDIASDVARHYQQANFAVDTDATAPDHIGHELQFLAYLCQLEAQAWEKGNKPIVAQSQQRQHSFLQTHLLYWLFPFTMAVFAQQDALYAEVMRLLTTELIHEHALSLEKQLSTIPIGTLALPSPPNILDQEKTGLRRIARYLTTPPYSGIFFSRDDIGALARQLDLPRGFGSREQMLENLLQTAVQYDLLSDLLNLLHSTLQHWHDTLHPYSAKFPNQITPWLQRLQTSQKMLQQIAAAK